MFAKSDVELDKWWGRCEKTISRRRKGGYEKTHSMGVVALKLVRGCSEDLHYDWPRNLPSNPSELLCICIVSAYSDSYVDSQNSLFCLLTCNNDHISHCQYYGML